MSANGHVAIHALQDSLLALRMGVASAENVCRNLAGWQRTRGDAFKDAIKDAIRCGDKLGFLLTADQRCAISEQPDLER